MLGAEKFWNIKINKSSRLNEDRDEASKEYDKSVKLTYEDLFVKHSAVENETQNFID